MLRILVVDDEEQIVRITQTFLTKNGYEVVSGGSGMEALAIFGKGEKIDLLVIDMKMPKMKGVEVLKELAVRKIRVPTIILTGSIDLKSYMDELGGEMGYSEEDVLMKPIDLNNLLDLVRKKIG